MKNERQANLELVEMYCRNQWTGSIGEPRKPHPRPSWFKRLLARLF